MRVFLCHSSHDKPAVRQLYQKLASDGFDVWFDEERLLPGQDWEREIAHAVRNTDTVVVCLSQSSITKTGFVQKEIRMALDAADEKPDGATFIIPARLEECNVPERLSRWQWGDLYKPDGYAKLIKSLRFAETKREEANNIAIDTNTKIETGIPNPAIAPDQTSKYSSKVPQRLSSRIPQQITIVLRTTGDLKADTKRVKQIYSILISFMGRDRFSFQLIENNQSYLIDFPDVTTRVCTELLDRLRVLMGEGNWRVHEIKF